MRTQDLVLPAAVSLLFFSRTAAAQFAPPPERERPPTYAHASPAEEEAPEAPVHRQADWLGARFDSWRAGVSIFGMRYLHMFEHGRNLPGGGPPYPAAAVGLGVDAGGINLSASQDSDKGAIVDAVLRGAVRVFPVGGISGEVTAGMATGPGGPIQVGSAGVFWSAYMADIGYSYAFPFAPARRPDWLSGGMFSMRFQIPLDPLWSTPGRG
jgi:hypothetical protein